MLIPEVTWLNHSMLLFKLSCSESSKIARGPQQKICTLASGNKKWGWGYSLWVWINMISVSLKSIFAKRRGASFELQKDCLKNPHGRRGSAASCRESLRLYSCISEALWSDSKQKCTSPAFRIQIPRFAMSSCMLANSGHVLCFCKYYWHGPSFPPE